MKHAVRSLVGVVCLLIYEIVRREALDDLAELGVEENSRPQAYQHEFFLRHHYDPRIIGISSCCMVLTLLLLLGSYFYDSFGRNASAVFKVIILGYAIINIYCIKLLCEAIFNSVAGMIFFVGAIPGACGLMFSLVVIANGDSENMDVLRGR